MSLLVTKLLSLFLDPLLAALVALVVVAALLATASRRAALALLIVVVSGLWIGSTPVVSNWLLGTLESQFPPAPISTLPQADVAVVLGGIVGQPLPPRVTPDLSDAVDRVFEASRLYHAGKVQHVLVSGGNLPWRAAVKPEALLIADLLVELGVPHDAVTTETESGDTHENAVNSSAILQARGWHTVFLITSGAHMPRALATFRRAGVEAMPASTDIHADYPAYESTLDLLPDSADLVRTTNAIKEWVGLLVYRLRGWA
jgi:uncharacterized SAM-binding protein YcdF (DUF218 family)